MRILLAEDERRLGTLVKRSLTEDGYVVDLFDDGQAALDAAGINGYDALILDIMLPSLDGITVCRSVRQTNTDIPIILLTALGGTDDRVNGLDNGADDYLVKPFAMAELSARIRALLRRGSAARPSVLTVGELVLDPAATTIRYRGTPLLLTAKEYGLLSYFMYHPGVVITKAELREHVWDMNYDGLSNVLETYVRYVRAKLRDAGTDNELITTIRNHGYKLETELGG